MPDGALYVGDGSTFANPFRVGRNVIGRTIQYVTTRQEAVDLFRNWLRSDATSRLYADQNLIVAHGQIWAVLASGGMTDRDLVCWCPLGEPCHADVLLELANKPRGNDAPSRR